MEDDHVKPQDESMKNSPKGSAPTGQLGITSVGDGFCYWNDKKYSDGGTVCDAHQRFKCWSGKWVDIGNC